MVSKRDEVYQAELIDTRPVPKVFLKMAGELIAVHPLRQAKTKGGLILPDGKAFDKQFETRRARVMAVGPEVTKCKVGDVIVVGDTAPAEVIYHKDQILIIMRQHDFFAIETDEDQTKSNE